jgi:hypothetical protein
MLPSIWSFVANTPRLPAVRSPRILSNSHIVSKTRKEWTNPQPSASIVLVRRRTPPRIPTERDQHLVMRYTTRNHASVESQPECRKIRQSSTQTEWNWSGTSWRDAASDLGAWEPNNPSDRIQGGSGVPPVDARRESAFARGDVVSSQTVIDNFHANEVRSRFSHRSPSHERRHEQTVSNRSSAAPYSLDYINAVV